MPIDMLSIISQSYTKLTSSLHDVDKSADATNAPLKLKVSPAPTPKSRNAETTVYPAEFQQPESRAGLLVTAELDTAIERCKAKVSRLAATCRRRNLRFRDIEFDLDEDRERCLHGLNAPTAEDRFTPADVLRIPEIFEDPQFFIDGATSGDIVQGDIGNCWFLSAVATVSTVPGLVERFCVARDEAVGVYGFIFWRDCGWVDVVIDDQLFISVPKYEELSAKEKRIYHEDKEHFIRSARRGSKSLYFARSGTENECWVPLLEKAFAKLHGDYASLQGGLAAEAVEDLVSSIAFRPMAVSTLIHSADVLDLDRFWKDELMRVNTDRLFGCYILRLRGENAPATINGLMTAHAYSVIKCVEYRGKRFCRIKNPWARSEWTGRWADGSREWTGEWLEPAALEALGHKFGEDGEFVMEVNSDFMKTWTMIERSRMFDETWRMSSLWLNVAALPPPSAWTFGDVSFTFSIPQRTNCVIVLAQVDSRYFKDISGYSQWSLEFSLFERGGTEPIGESVHSVFWTRSVATELELDAGDYVVHVRMDRRSIRSKDYFKDGVPNWDMRKLTRIWSQAALSNSIASNFNAEYYRDLLPVPLSKYAGLDLTKLELDTYAAVTKKRQDTMRTLAAAAAAAQSPAYAIPMPLVTSPSEEQVIEASFSMSSLVVSVDVPETPMGHMDMSAQEVKGAAPVNGHSALEDDEEHLLAPSVFGGSSIAKPTGPANDLDAVLSLTIQSAEDSDQSENLDAQDRESERELEADNDNDLDREQERTETSDPPVPPYRCDGCGSASLVAVHYDLCSRCMDAGVHPRDHRFMRVDQADDMAKMQATSVPGDEDDVVLGLRVYTHRDAPATIKGQIRHGRVVQWTKE
ncbi:cysteine proteinase [Auriculariales sp. MPI-PUGE-AT-0066]|nr:cysteine proteinase [Auriculariales sp. MPI-PUGE-AT-0066]